MRTITFRRFMNEVETLTEPVQLILTKRETGEVLTLGEFYPRGTSRDYATFPAEVSPKKDPPAQQTFRPVPKPVPTKK